MHRIIKISPWYYIGLLIWFGIYLLRKNGAVIPLVNNHLTDLYSVPMFCYTIDIAMYALFKTNKKTKFKDILFSSIYLTIIFEIICPQISPIYTADFYDFLCYLIGGIVYYLVLKIRFIYNYS